MLNDINNFIKWLVLKTFMIKKVSNATKVASFFIFLSESYFLLDQFNFKCNLKNLYAGVYSSTNSPPFTGSQNSILNWVLKLNPLNQKSQSLPLFSYGVCLFIAARIIFLKHQSWRSSYNPTAARFRERGSKCFCVVCSKL